jgi:iron(III) transport system permease protein
VSVTEAPPTTDRTSPPAARNAGTGPVWRGRLVNRLIGHLPVAAALLILAVLIVAPLGLLLYGTFVDVPPRPGADMGRFTWENYSSVGSAGTRDAFVNTVIVGVFGAGLAVLIGGAIAWAAARTDVPWRGLVQVIGIAPLFVSPFVGSIAWSFLASPRSGYINVVLRDLGVPLTVNFHSLLGMTVVSALYYSPYVFIFVNSSLLLMNPELEEAAQIHGAGLRQVLSNVTLRLATPAIMGSAILVLVLIMENFSVPLILGYSSGIETLSTRIFGLVNAAPSAPSQAAATGVVLAVITFLLVHLQRRVTSARDYVTVTGKGFKPRTVSLGRWRVLALVAVLAYAFVAILLPFFALFQAAFRNVQFVPDAASLFDPGAFGLRFMRQALELDTFKEALGNSMVVGVLAAVTGGVLYLFMSYLVNRTRKPGRKYIEYIAMWPVAVPSLVIGLGFLWFWISVPLPIYGTIVVLILAFVAHFMPQGFRGISSSINQIDRDLEEAALMSGADRLRANIAVTLPLIRTGIVSTMLLLFILSMRELSTAIFLFTSDTRLLSILVYDQWESGNFPRVAAISLVYSAILLVVTLVARRWFGAKEEKV